MAKVEDAQSVTIDGHRLKISNLDKVLYPKTQTTKAEVLAYYAEIAPVMLPHVTNRPATRKRWPDGVGTDDHVGPVFFQKNLASSTPDWVHRRVIEHKGHTNEYPLVNDRATLTWLAQLAALEIHVPQWKFGSRGAIKNPDRIVLDLDPGDGVGLAECAQVARRARQILTELGLKAYPVTSGSKGIHLYAQMDGKQTSEEVSLLAKELAKALQADQPDLVVSDMKRGIRSGKVFVDWSQNSAAKTTVAPYSMRGRARPTVAAPRTWEELESPGLQHLLFDQVLQRVRDGLDPLADLDADNPQEQSATADRLTIYRGKRDAAKTPEPVPAEAPAAAEGNSFVIQEHHARRLHWDFRLEHDGVLVSWALPKGPPTDPKKNHLAVQTEDHPLEYGSFEGSIPAGQYGGGEVTIWDEGTYQLHKWRNGQEVIATLYGKAGGGLSGPRKFALIHTGRRGQPEKNWLIHLMDPDKQVTSIGRAADEPSTDPSTGPATRSPGLTPAASRHELTPMLATMANAKYFRHEQEWAFEMKWDGVRVLAYLDDGSVHLASRKGHDVTAMYPEVAEQVAQLKASSAVFDGEIVALDAQGRPQFSLLQNRINLSKPADIARGRQSTPVQLIVFDLLELNGSSLLKQTYEARRSVLIDLMPAGSTRIQAPPAFDGDLTSALETSAALELEGVVAKRRDSSYMSGQRATSWLKIKHHKTQEVVIGGWRPGQGRRNGGVGSLLLGVYTGDQLRYVGRVGTGFSDRDLDDLQTKVNRLARKTSPLTDVPAPDARDAHWITPSLVGEVEFTGWTGTGRLRHPSWRGWRRDLDPSDVKPQM